MILTVDGETHTLESQMRQLVINGRETTADEWNRPDAVEERSNSHHGRTVRRSFVAKASAEIIPRRRGVLAACLHWLSQDVS